MSTSSSIDGTPWPLTRCPECGNAEQHTATCSMRPVVIPPNQTLKLRPEELAAIARLTAQSSPLTDRARTMLADALKHGLDDDQREALINELEHIWMKQMPANAHDDGYDFDDPVGAVFSLATELEFGYPVNVRPAPRDAQG
jgi:uncharacterized protein YhdP